MEDLSTLIWIGIAVLWLLARLFRRGARKVAGQQKSPPRPATPRPEAQRTRTDRQSDFSGRGGTGPPPIVPR